MQILTEYQEGLLKDERQLLSDLRVALARFGAPAEDQATLDESIRQLDDLFLLVVVGEFNSGKSAFINAMLGQRVLEEGEIPTTAQIHVLRHGESQQHSVISDRLHVLTAPVTLLEQVSIVDTPGTNSIIERHQEITSEFVPRSDLVLFITSADRPFTDSERLFLQQIRDWGKKLIVVVNKIDILQGEGALDKVSSFVADGVRSTLGIEPHVFPISAQLALRAKLGEPTLWQKSRFEPLETKIHETLEEESRLCLKLLNPLGVGGHLIERYLGFVNEQMTLFQQDVEMLENVERQLTVFQQDMRRDFDLHMEGMENILLEMERRGRDYFDEVFRLRRILDLLDKKQIQRGFERQVVGDAPQRIEQKVNELIDWLVDSDVRQWQAVTDYLAERRRQHEEKIVGTTSNGGFHYEHERMFGNLGREVRQLVDEYDKEQEARLIADGAQSAVATVAAVEVGAIGLGALVTVIASTAAADATGILMASVVAVLGLFIIPNRRSRAEKEMRLKVSAVRENLVSALNAQFERELERILQRINKTVAPYTRYVRAERGKLLDTEAELGQLGENVGRLRGEIEQIAAGGGV